ncbi:hypothetical protein JGI7_02317, partial [Candidatus Kryptonium thompsonii]
MVDDLYKVLDVLDKLFLCLFCGFNVIFRQLENAIKRAIIFAKSSGRNLIQLKDLPEEIAKSVKGKIDIEEKILNLLREKKFSHSAIS